MKKILTIGLAAAALAGGVVATSGAAQAADWNHVRYEHGRYEGGYRHHEICRMVWRYSPRYHHRIRQVVCY
jgi:hypothetical protein